MAHDGHLHNTDTSSIFIITPQNKSEVSNPINIKFGLTGMNIVPAGVEKERSGHHHLLIDVKELPDMNNPIPSTPNHIHFGKGQTETTITLTPGKHTLQLLLGNHLHVPHNPPVISKKITINVK